MGKSSAAKVLEDTDFAVEAKEPEPIIIRDVELPVEDVEDVEAEAPVEDKKSPYPEGTELFSWTPKSGDEILEFPMHFDKPDKVWLWDQGQLPFLSQTFRWMERAKVPKEIQRRACALPDDEYMDMFTAWFKAMGGGATPGE